MKILVIQLARFGDIYLTWPALRALRRQYPDAQIDLMVRERFVNAAIGLGSGVNVVTFPTQAFIRPLVERQDDDNLMESYEALSQWLHPLMHMQYDRVCNLSFSPLSSFLTQLVAGSHGEVRGYSRHSDGHFFPVDDTSAYFYGQIGIGKSNRYHLTQVMASVCGVDLVSEDWGYFAELPEPPPGAPNAPYILFHVGASDLQKAYSSFKITQTIKRLESESGWTVALIGASNEAGIARQILEGSGLKKAVDLVGKTTLPELFTLIRDAALVVGPDSAPIHVAAHMGVRALNLSFANVTFWETGPVSPGSQILVANAPEDLPSDQVSRTIQALLADETPYGVWVRDSFVGDYAPTPGVTRPPDFRWRLIEALYTGSDFPETTDKNILTAFKRLYDLSDLAVTELGRAVDGRLSPTAFQILGSVDQLLEEVPRLVPEVQPVTDWFQTERVRIPPLPPSELIAANTKVFSDFRSILKVYVNLVSLQDAREQSLEICRRLADSLGDWDVKKASLELSEFLEMCRTMSRISPKVGASDLKWSNVLQEVEKGFAKKDYLRLADLLTYEISPALENWVS